MALIESQALSFNLLFIPVYLNDQWETDSLAPPGQCKQILRVVQQEIS